MARTRTADGAWATAWAEAATGSPWFRRDQEVTVAQAWVPHHHDAITTARHHTTTQTGTTLTDPPQADPTRRRDPPS